MDLITVTGASGALGQRLVPQLLLATDRRVVGVDPRPSPFRAGRFEMVRDGAAVFPEGAGVGTVVHLIGAGAADPDRAESAHASLDGTRRALELATAGPAEHFVLLSSAMVYGGWPDNPVPLTEDSVLRPNPGLVVAAHRAEAERLAREWAAAHPGSCLSVVRPVSTVGSGDEGGLTRALMGRDLMNWRGAQPPRQFVHIDDVASALALVVAERAGGTFNVAPDGWIPSDTVRELTSGRLAVPVPAHLAPYLTRSLWALGLSDLAPAALALVRHPWVVANDRIRSLGWTPRWTNEEALVAGRPPSWWREMTPHRRQQLALAIGGTGAAITATGSAAALAGRARRNRRRRS